MKTYNLFPTKNLTRPPYTAAFRSTGNAATVQIVRSAPGRMRITAALGGLSKSAVIFQGGALTSENIQVRIDQPAATPVVIESDTVITSVASVDDNLIMEPSLTYVPSSSTVSLFIRAFTTNTAAITKYRIVDRHSYLINPNITIEALTRDLQYGGWTQVSNVATNQVEIEPGQSLEAVSYDTIDGEQVFSTIAQYRGNADRFSIVHTKLDGMELPYAVNGDGMTMLYALLRADKPVRLERMRIDGYEYDTTTDEDEWLYSDYFVYTGYDDMLAYDSASIENIRQDYGIQLNVGECLTIAILMIKPLQVANLHDVEFFIDYAAKKPDGKATVLVHAKPVEAINEYMLGGMRISLPDFFGEAYYTTNGTTPTTRSTKYDHATGIELTKAGEYNVKILIVEQNDQYVISGGEHILNECEPATAFIYQGNGLQFSKPANHTGQDDQLSYYYSARPGLVYPADVNITEEFIDPPGTTVELTTVMKQYGYAAKEYKQSFTIPDYDYYLDYFKLTAVDNQTLQFETTQRATETRVVETSPDGNSWNVLRVADGTPTVTLKKNESVWIRSNILSGGSTLRIRSTGSLYADGDVAFLASRNGNWPNGLKLSFMNTFMELDLLSAPRFFEHWKIANIQLLSNAFNGCRNLPSIDLHTIANPDGKMNPSNLFANCSKLMAITFDPKCKLSSWYGFSSYGANNPYTGLPNGCTFSCSSTAFNTSGGLDIPAKYSHVTLPVAGAVTATIDASNVITVTTANGPNDKTYVRVNDKAYPQWQEYVGAGVYGTGTSFTVAGEKEGCLTKFFIKQ